MPYAVRTHAPRPAKRLVAEGREIDWVELESEEEMLGARSSMPKTLQRKDRGAMYVMRHACRHRGQARLSEAGFYYGFAAGKHKNESRDHK